MGRKVWVIPSSEEPHPDEMLAESTIRMVEMGTHQYVKSQNGSTWSLDPIAGVTLTNGSRGQVGHVAERGRLDRDSSELSIWGGHLSVLLDCCHMRMPIQSGQRNPSPHFYPKCFRFKTLKIIPLKKKKTTSLIKHIKLPGHQVLTAALWSGKEKLIERGPKPEASIIAEGWIVTTQRRSNSIPVIRSSNKGTGEKRSDNQLYWCGQEEPETKQKGLRLEIRV